MGRMTLEKLALLTDAGFREMTKRFETIDERFKAVDKRFEDIDRRFEAIDKRFEAIDKRFDDMELRFDAKFGGIDRRLDYHADAYVTQFQHKTLMRRVDQIARRVKTSRAKP